MRRSLVTSALSKLRRTVLRFRSRSAVCMKAPVTGKRHKPFTRRHYRYSPIIRKPPTISLTCCWSITAALIWR